MSYHDDPAKIDREEADKDACEKTMGNDEEPSCLDTGKCDKCEKLKETITMCQVIKPDLRTYWVCDKCERIFLEG